MILFIGCSTVQHVIFAANDSVYRLLYCTSMWFSCKWFCLSVALLYINVIFTANDSVYRLLYCTSTSFSLQRILFIGCSTVHQCDIRCKWFCLLVALLYINVIFPANDSVYRLLYCTSTSFSLQIILFIGCSTVYQCDIRCKWFCLSVALLSIDIPCKWFCLSVALLYINLIFAANDSVYRLLYWTSMWYSLQMILFIGCSTVHQRHFRGKWFCLSVALLYINVIFEANDSVYRLLYCTSMWYSLQMILFIGCSTVRHVIFIAKDSVYRLLYCTSVWYSLQMILFIGCSTVRHVIFIANDSVYRLLYCPSMWYLLQMILFIGCSTVHHCDSRCKWFCLSVALLYINLIFAANDSVYWLRYWTSMWYSLQMILFIGCSTVHQRHFRCKWFCL